MNPENTNKLKQRVAPGIWIDQNNHVHLSIPELLQVVDLPNTPENREIVKQMAAKLVRKQCPEAIVLFRANEKSKGEKI